jgi:hypothetical protein
MFEIPNTSDQPLIYILFRTNEMRLNVTKVLDRVASQLQKSSILDDPIKLIYSVMHSNDCIARALTLRFVFLKILFCFYSFFKFYYLELLRLWHI